MLRSQPIRTHIRTFVLFVFAVVVTCSSIYFFRSSSVQNVVKTSIFQGIPFLHRMCEIRHTALCDTLGEVTAYLPCFPSTLLYSKIACHDSYSCQKQPRKTKINRTTDVSRRVFFSALYTDDNFLEGALLLGYTLKKYHPHHQMYIMYFENALSNRTLCSLRQVGWILKLVHNIAPPFKGTASHFIHQFTKLTLWNMTEFDSITYLDVDTLVLSDISHLNELVADPLRTGFEFAAVADNWYGKFAFHFNAGVLVLHPSSVVFKELVRTMSLPGNYHPKMAEQAFLNAFFQLRYLQLPLIYNVNLAMYSAYPDLWKNMQQDFKIVHFTLVKPFLKQSNNAYDVPLKLYNDVLDEYMKTTVSNQVKIKCV